MVTWIRSYWWKWAGGLSIVLAFIYTGLFVVEANRLSTALHCLALYGVAVLLAALLLKKGLKQAEIRNKLAESERALLNMLKLQPGFTFQFVKRDGQYVYSLIQGELLYELGLKPDMFIGKALSEVHVLTADYQRMLNSYYDRAWSGERVTYEIDYHDKHLLITLKPTETGVIGTAVDMTVYQTMDRERREAEEHSKAKTRLMNKASHELRTPLNGVFGLLRLLRQTELNEAQQSYLDKLHDAAGQLHGMVNELLDTEHVPVEKDSEQNEISCDVIVAEDNEINQIVIEGLLESIGVAPVLVSNGQELLRALQQKRYDIIFLDLQMPVMDGLSAAREIRKDARYAGTPIIALTANSIEEPLAFCAEHGLNGLLIKPIDEKRLIYHLKSWVKLQWLDDVKGVDGRALLNQMDGKLMVAQYALFKFVQEYKGFAASLRKQYWAGDEAGVKRSLHTLRGVAASLKADQLAETAARLEQLPKGKEEAEPYIASLELQIEQIAESIPFSLLQSS